MNNYNKFSLGFIFFLIILNHFGMLATLNNWALSTTTDVLQYITTPKQEQNKTTSILITSATPTTIISQTPTTTPTTLSTINYKTGKQTKQFKYILNGNMNNITFDMYYGIMNKISSDTHPYSCMRYTYDTSPCNNTEIEKYYIPKDEKLKELKILVNKQQLRTEFFESIWKALDKLAWILKLYVQELKGV